MLHPSTKKLIDKLGDMTRRQKVIWQEADDGRMTHDTEGYRVTLTPDPYTVVLTDSQDREIESCAPADYADDQDARGRPYSLVVEELYREAKRHARGAEAAISAVLAGLDAVESDADDPANLTVETSANVETLSEMGEVSVEDPLDDSSPLDADAYREMDSQSDITSAVASLADQVNAPLPASEATGELAEDEILTDENTGVTLDVADTEPQTDIAASEPEEAAGSYDTEDEEQAISAFGVTPDDAPAAMEPAAEPGPLDDPAAGFTPSGYVSEPQDVDADSAPLGNFQPEATLNPDSDRGETFQSTLQDAEHLSAAETTNEDALDLDDAPPAADTPAEAADDAAPAPSGTFMNAGGFFGGGYGSSLGGYAQSTGSTDASDSTVQDTDAPHEAPDDVAATTETTSDPSPVAVDPEPATSLPSYSLSGIGSPAHGEDVPTDTDAAEPADPEGSSQVVIDATHDQYWSDPSTARDNHDVDDTGPVVDEPGLSEISPHDAELAEAAADEIAPAEPEADTEAETSSEAPQARPVKRFNPWN